MTDHEHHGMKPLAGLANYCRRSHRAGKREDRFGRMFPDLAPSYVSQPKLSAVGSPGGPMDAGAAKPKTTSVPVGMVFFGQFVDHDITLDASTSFVEIIDDAGQVTNVRSPTLDLDCIYGLGPEAQPYVYAQTPPFNGAKLLTGADTGLGGLADSDLLRAPNGRAIIGDPRNDENRIISQMQLAMIRFHNHVCETLNTEEGLTGAALYEAARRLTTWHYQWNVVNDLLGAMCGEPVVSRILACGRRFYCGGVPYIPVEFSVAAYRFGHSMIPMAIQTQQGGASHDLFGAVLGGGFLPLDDPAAVVDFHELFFTPENREVELADKLDTKLASILLALPFIANPDEKSLAVRNLMRGNAFLLPGGDKIAEHMERSASELDNVRDKIEDLGPIGREGIPLWLYVLAEAETIGREESNGNFSKGEGLGPVGATIVAETIIGLLELDEDSFLGANRNWSPREEWASVGRMLTVAQP
jgi:hypothetical protein